jgi:hypothetical protein
MKQTFIHTFKNGNRCVLILDFTGPKAHADAQWDRKVDAEWPQIEREYKLWREECFNQFTADKTPDQMLEILIKSSR